MKRLIEFPAEDGSIILMEVDEPEGEGIALLDCARYSMTAPDIYDSDYFAEEARKIAQAEGWPDLIASAERMIEESKRKLILPD